MCCDMVNRGLSYVRRQDLPDQADTTPAWSSLFDVQVGKVVWAVETAIRRRRDGRRSMVVRQVWVVSPPRRRRVAWGAMWRTITLPLTLKTVARQTACRRGVTRKGRLPSSRVDSRTDTELRQACGKDSSSLKTWEDDQWKIGWRLHRGGRILLHLATQEPHSTMVPATASTWNPEAAARATKSGSMTMLGRVTPTTEWPSGSPQMTAASRRCGTVDGVNDMLILG